LLRRVLKWLLIVIAGLVAIAYGVFGGTSVCARCGRLRTTTELQVPLVGIPYFRFHGEQASLLSAVLDERGLRRGHAHDWQFGVGAGNGIMCAIGPGRHLLGAVGDHQVAAFVRNLAEYGSATEVEGWVKALLDIGTSQQAWQLLRQFPEAGFARRAEFQGWRAAQGLSTFPFDGTP
jgi:hypothetical protein